MNKYELETTNNITFVSPDNQMILIRGERSAPVKLIIHAGNDILMLRRENAQPHDAIHTLEPARGSSAIGAVNVSIPFTFEKQFKLLQEAIAIRGNHQYVLASGEGQYDEEHGRVWGRTLDLSEAGLAALRENLEADKVWYAARREGVEARAASRAVARGTVPLVPA